MVATRWTADRRSAPGALSWRVWGENFGIIVANNIEINQVLYDVLNVYVCVYIYRLDGVDVAPTEGLDHVADGAARLAGGAPLKLHTE